MSKFNLDRLDQITAGDPKLRREILSLFRDTKQRCMKAMLENERNSDPRPWKEAIHELKGAADNLGFTFVADICREAEADLKAGRLTNDTKQIFQQRIESALLEVQQIIY